MVEKMAVLNIVQLKKLQWGKIFNMLYVEPVLFLLVFAHSLSGTIMRNQVIYQACTTVFNYNVSDCEQLGTSNLSDYTKSIETEVQPYVANLFMIRTLLESIVPAICGVFVGSWSDHYGRKPLLVISMIGFSFTYIIAAVICEISRFHAVNPWYYIIAVLPHSLLGGNCVFSVAIFCYISDVTDTKARPYRMIFMEVFFFIGLMTGSLLSSFVYAATNATITFAISGVLMCIATAFIVFYVPESLNYKKTDENTVCNTTKDNCCNLKAGSSQLGNMFNNIKSAHEIEDGKVKTEPKESMEMDVKKTTIVAIASKKEDCEGNTPAKSEDNLVEKKVTGLFSYVHIKDMLATCFKKRPYNDRSIIWLVTGAMFLSIFVIDGVMTVFYLFVREKFQWTIRDYTFFETVSHMVPMFGAIIGFLILRKVFKMSVVALAILAFFCEILTNIVKGVATDTWHLYLSLALGVFKSIGGPMCRTIVSNIVPPTDLGKIFSIKNILQSVAPFLAAPLYTVIYKESLTTFPGLFNIVSAGLYLIAFIFMIAVLRFKFTYKEHYAEILK